MKLSSCDCAGCKAAENISLDDHPLITVTLDLEDRSSVELEQHPGVGGPRKVKFRKNFCLLSPGGTALEQDNDCGVDDSALKCLGMVSRYDHIVVCRTQYGRTLYKAGLFFLFGVGSAKHSVSWHGAATRGRDTMQLAPVGWATRINRDACGILAGMKFKNYHKNARCYSEWIVALT